MGVNLGAMMFQNKTKNQKRPLQCFSFCKEDSLEEGLVCDYTLITWANLNIYVSNGLIKQRMRASENI